MGKGIDKTYRWNSKGGSTIVPYEIIKSDFCNQLFSIIVHPVLMYILFSWEASSTY